ncbi:hypothetical protein TPHA_0E03240 [Tetrapisispora phaffii CBS 4417]|uniref:Presequence translocated-associated motor subunit PAM17 n=1 Tax=Tetrapisispora phaffii (strain ATCC 24235 / CBS 4417 / NBRC 1672 / NRRL Y-8282 / UCD 70-5) TaxID=1071381 RepID=G8BU36_TETPH|nr:hypothetical protein TPHA_0E03240 [Tetrapisispora phaffii CBS 4417]CCE63414.1 hypothetical protein TPHA_0E03240 [Tetrapisispora phaffii CBS 4417]
MLSSTVRKSTLQLTKPIWSIRSLSAKAPVTSQTSEDAKGLTWADFFALRRTERKINVGSSIFTALVGSNLSWAYLSTMQIDPTQTLLGFDPLVAISAGLIASGTLGYLFGPLLGSQIFNVGHSKKLKSYTAKNKEFLKKIISNRVDASSQSFSNPVPDYYGEKIGSIKEYRQWLRDCHAYRRKAKEFL